VGEESFLNVSSSAREWARKVLDEALSLALVEDLVPQDSWLFVWGIWMRIFESTSLSANCGWGPSLLWILLWSVESVWLVVDSRSEVAVDCGCTVSLVVRNSSSVGAVDWDLLIVLSESISVGVWVGEESSLEHLVGGWLNAWDEMAWGEGGLLDLGVVVLWVPVKSHLTNSDEWIVGLWPDLGNIEDVISVVVGVFLWHDLDEPGP